MIEKCKDHHRAHRDTEHTESSREIAVASDEEIVVWSSGVQLDCASLCALCLCVLCGKFFLTGRT